MYRHLLFMLIPFALGCAGANNTPETPADTLQVAATATADAAPAPLDSVVAPLPPRPPLPPAKPAAVITEAVVRKKVHLDVCLVQAEARLPKISGLKDKGFQARLNKIIKENFERFVAQARESSVCDPKYSDSQYMWSDYDYSYEILTNRDSVLSVWQETTFRYNNGGNGGRNFYATLTADVKNKVVFGLKEFGMDTVQGLQTRAFRPACAIYPDLVRAWANITDHLGLSI